MSYSRYEKHRNLIRLSHEPEFLQERKQLNFFAITDCSAKGFRGTQFSLIGMLTKNQCPGGVSEEGWFKKGNYVLIGIG